MRKAHQTQRPLLSSINRFISANNANDIIVKPYWIANCIAILNAPVALVSQLADHMAVSQVQSNAAFKSMVHSEMANQFAPSTSQTTSSTTSTSPSSIEWNIEWVEATAMWQKGFKGAGITVGVADTGIQWDHPALKDHYRGFNVDSKAVDHNYNWWDSIHTPVVSPGHSKCGYNITAPCDDYGHGTHCTGTAVGGTADKGIGVAPDSKFIGCRNMDAGNGRPHTYIECLQFFMAPTDLQGLNADTSKRPHVVSNSYGCETSEKCEPNSMKDAVEAIVAAGVFMSVAAGNSGPGCSSASSGPGIYQSSFTVGALGFKSNKIAGFSSRGPVTSDKSNRRKPDISAPGSSIISSFPPNTYTALSGTSMATPHVAGCVSLLWSAIPELVRQIEKTEFVIERSALNITSTDCHSVEPYTPNNVYGYGGIQIEKAYELGKGL